MRPRGKIGGCFELIKEENLESSVIRKGLFGFIVVDISVNSTNNIIVIGEESKVYAKTNNADTNILMRDGYKNGTEEVKNEI